ncbi:DUF3576 domain-containing protein [Caldovatus aquaticus]|uniref:DUF3576 domain-containing protein n=1 Tax=Caldovatus aquaticus TaxID=2865671 RepID=A0ABS7F5R1_9PROT|nr:DUF3576 domain-containing protein [Caldovatus aquaticus]MBW8270961.1 DUF3576 domain-containing protein [Caldovatus aquaticus]
MRHASRLALALALLGLAAAACGETRSVRNDEYGDDSRRARVQGRLSGASDGLVIFGVDRSRPPGSAGDPGGGPGLGVNAYLWRATLDTLSFMPLASADPFGGVIITDWYSPPAEPGERFRATAYLLGRTLRSDNVRVSVFRQVRDRNGNWVDQPVSPGTAAALEDSILARARELRSQSLAAR